MTSLNLFRSITRKSRNPLKALAVGAVAFTLLAGASNVQAATFNWTNTTGATYDDPTAYNPAVGGPGGNADLANFTSLTGSVNVNLNSNYIESGSVQFGSPGSGSVTYNLNFGTNIFAAYNGTGGSSSGFVIGQQGTSTVYLAVGSLYVTNGANPVNTRFTISRNAAAVAVLNVTNGNVIAGTLVLCGNATANAKLVLSGAGTSWSNNNVVSIGNVASANFNALVISNSASMITLGAVQPGFSATSNSNSVMVASNGKLITRAASNTIGSGGGSVGNTITIQDGGVWENGGRIIAVGNTTGGGNALVIGSNGTVTNVSTVTIAPANSLTLSGGVLFASVGVTNTAGTVGGFGTISSGNVVLTNTGTLTPGFGTTVGQLRVNNNVALVAGSTTIIKLDKSQTGSNDVISVGGTLAEGGTLTINNVGPALVGGDTFKILSATVSGSFGTINLPTLSGSLVWNTTQLNSQGIISVVLPPTIIGPDPQAVLAGSNVVISTVTIGVPVPGLQWQFGGVNTSDGATGNGSTITGSTSGTLTILNAQIADSGQYCLIASNVGGVVTNCMTLEVTTNTAAPLIGGPTDQNVISPNAATFTAVVVGIPQPTQQWQDNGVNIANETNMTLVIPGVTFALDGHVYCIIASNSVGTATNCATLHVVVPPDIQTQPVSLVVTQTQSATFTVVSTNGVPAPTYQWFFNNVAISGANSASYTIPSAVPANDGNYNVTVANVVGTVTSSNATLTVNSTMVATLTPTNAATAVCYDTPLYLTFDRTPVSSGTGKIKIFNTAGNTLVDTIDTSLGPIQPRTIGTESFITFPVIITNNLVTIYPHLGVMSSNQTYYVTVDSGTFAETNGAFFAGVTATNAWSFTTKSAPATPNNLVVAADGSGDFCTVQGAVDSLPNANTTPTLVSIHNGTYTEIVDTRNKNNVTFRGQSRTGTIVGYRNNDAMNSGTHARMAFKIFSSDMTIENMTVVNTTPQGGTQAEALMIESGAGHFILNNAEVDSRQDTILANVNSSQGYFYNSLIQGNFDYIWGGGNLFFTNCEMRTIPTASNYNLTAARTDNGATGNWAGFGGLFSSNGFSIVNCRLTRSSSTVSNITLAGANGTQNGVVAFIGCSIDTSNNNGYVTPAAGVLASQLLWEFGNSNLTGTAAAPLGLTVLTNGDARLLCASSATCWLNGWVPQLAPNILTNPVSVTVTAGVSATFSVVATGIPDPSYQWLKNGATISGATSTSLTINNAHCADAATYSVIVSNIAGSVTSSNAVLTVIGSAPVANFTATPISGTEPLVVSFTDTSTSALSVLWNFGDLSTSNTAAGATVSHTYAAGTYTVSLTASNACDVSTLTSNNLITVITSFQAWQLLHFGCTNCPQAAATADPDGDGQNNLAEFLSGTDPNNSASGLHITSVAPSGSDVVITWSTAGGGTNVVQATAGDGNGGFSTNFTDLSGPIIITGSGDTSTNYTDAGGGTNIPARYYRVRLAP